MYATCLISHAQVSRTLDWITLDALSPLSPILEESAQENPYANKSLELHVGDVAVVVWMVLIVKLF